MRFCFVILHYLAEETTSKCIDTLVDLTSASDVEIIVVDNASPNGSGTTLKERYCGNNHVHFILLNNNEGFARGNNAGYLYAYENFSPDFIVVMNNDVMINDRNFTQKVENEYKNNAFAVLGPDIFCPITGKHQNPAHLSGFSEKEVLNLRDKLLFQLKHYYLKRFCWKLKLFFGLAHDIPADKREENIYKTRHSDCVLHGACYIFSKDFIKNREYAFNPNTFLYFEEDILHYECTRDNLKMIYSPDICVNHLEDVSTNIAFKNKLRKEKIIKERALQSISVMIAILQNDRKC